ncbi:EamA family transporter RarD [Novosphingobium sp. 1949]|uniref:EamA family transporter RarD n=1 Tax=Novosphingobium organovorum TaxID=2930092 RepID=A0ABT0BHX6_9SPHN|nr:EamA family transporter RarD [Novosphingobium organovorum]MCJ2184676.1 EamA family transporter RarD [Novosphingobium organovorum]
MAQGAQSRQATGGLPYALVTYFGWGLFPLYFAALRQVPAFEMVGWRIVFTLPFCAVMVVWKRQVGAVVQALRDPRTLGILCASALAIGANWTIYVWSVQQGHVLAASLGYYINPLLNVLAGTLFLGERLNRLQWCAVALAATGVAVLAIDALAMLWISLALGACFCVYGLLRKRVAVESLPGLAVESLILTVPGVLVVSAYALGPSGSSFGQAPATDALIALSGVLTGLPLLLFAVAARRMDYSTLGFVQFLTPTMVFALGVFVFHEPVRTTQLVCFAFLWSAVALFSFDLLRRKAASRG